MDAGRAVADHLITRAFSSLNAAAVVTAMDFEETAVTKNNKGSGSQPEVLAGLAAAARARGQKPKEDGLIAVKSTAPVREYRACKG